MMPSPTIRHQVDPFGGPASEDDFLGAARANESGHPFPGALVGAGRAVAQLMDAPVNIGVIMLIIVPERFKHLPGLLRGGGIVEVDQRMPVNLLIEDRKIPA